MGINILVVDDSTVMRAMIIKTLRMSGLDLGEIHEAANGAEGLDALSRQWTDLVILDINMPVMNGEDMLKQMRESPETRDIPAIIISTEGSKTRIDRLVKLGASFVHKPFTPELIRSTINQRLGIGGDHE